MDEAEKIKVELAELKKKKKVLDSSKTKKAKVKPAKKTTRKKMHHEKMMKLEIKNMYINLTISEIVKNNLAMYIDENSTSSSDSEIIRCMILHAFRNSFGIENLKSGLQEYEKNSGSKQSSKIPITLNNRMFQIIAVFKNNFEYKTQKKITTSQILNSLIYYASQNNFNNTLIPEYIHILESYSKTENALKKKRKTNNTNKTENNFKNEYSTIKEEVTGNYAQLIEYDSEKSDKDSKSDEIQTLEEKRETLRGKINQMDFEINEIKQKEEKIKTDIFFEKSQKEEREGKGISKLFNKFSKKNKPLDEYSMKLFQKKNSELDQIEIEIKDKLEGKEKTNLEIKLIDEKIERIKESDREIERLENKIRQERQVEVVEEEKVVEEGEANSMKGGVCKGICKQFKVKRPQNGKRYDSGQARCQICEQWIDHRGSHLKNNIPATEYSVGWYCNCCNYRVRQKPRNKVYKEKLAEDIAGKKTIFELINQNPCPKCGVKPTVDNIESIFGMRISGGGTIRQSHCRECRNSHHSTTDKKENRVKIGLTDIERFVNSKNMSNTQPYTSVLNKFVNLANQFPDESLMKIFESRFILGIKSANTVRNQKSIIQNFENFLKPQDSKIGQGISKQILDSNESSNKKNNVDETNLLISEALEIIRKNSSGVYKKRLAERLMLTENEFEGFLPKLLRIEDIVEEDDGFNKFLRSIENNDEIIQEQSTEKETVLPTNIERIEKIRQEHAPEIEKITMHMIQRHILWKRNINKELKRKVITEFVEFRSLTKIYEKHPHDTNERIRAHIITDLRLPTGLKKLENEGGLHPNLTCSLAIALYATDYFHWDGKKEDEEKVIDLAISISKYLNSNNQLNNLFLNK